MGEDLPQKFGQYTLHELIARGGMAEIYRATMPGIGDFEKTVAIKKILPHLAEDDEFVTMLVDEARIIESLDHSNIAQVYDLGKLEDTYYIAMEYIHGVDLADIVEELGDHGERVPIEHVVYITSSICAGLHFAHSKTDEDGEPLNIVHRDISLHNVLLSFAGEVKIIDFGVAKAAGREARTKMGVIKGKLLYMAPEQAKAEDLDGRADLFATGLCAYKMLTGELPFEGENEFQVYNNILSKDIVPPKEMRSDVPDELNRIVMKLLKRDPDERYQDGYAVKQDLDRLLHEVAPGYTANRLSRFVQENFSHLVRSDEHDEATQKSDPTNMTPSTPPGGAPETGRHDADQMETDVSQSSPAAEPVREEVHDDAAQASPPDVESTIDEDPANFEGAPPSEQDAESGPRRTEMDEGETGKFEPSAPEVDDDGPPAIVYAIGGLVVVIGGMIAYAMVGGSKQQKDSSPSPEETSSAVESVELSLDSEPAGARLLRAGQAVGRTPLEINVPRSDEALELTLQKEGYEKRKVQVVPADTVDRTFELKAASGAATGDTGTADADSGKTDAGGAPPASDKEDETTTAARQEDDEATSKREESTEGSDSAGGAGGRDESGARSADDEAPSGSDEERAEKTDSSSDETADSAQKEEEATSPADSEESKKTGDGGSEDGVPLFDDSGSDDSGEAGSSDEESPSSDDKSASDDTPPSEDQSSDDSQKKSSEDEDSESGLKNPF